METILHGPQQTSNRKEAAAISLRDRAMLEMFYAGALRVSEIVGVKLEDLKLDMGYVLVRGKGDKERIVPLGRSAQNALTIYKRCAPPIGGREELSLSFPRTRGPQANAAANLANGPGSLGNHRTQSQPAYAAPQLRHSHGGKRR